MFLNVLSGFTWNINFETTSDAITSVAILLTLAIILVFAVCAIAIKGDTKIKFLKIGGIASVAYSCVLGIIFMTLNFIDDGIEKILFFPLLFLLLSIGINSILLFTVKKKWVIIETACAISAAIIATLVCITIHYSSMDSDSKNSINSPVLYICAAILVAAIIFAALFFGRKDKSGFESKSITYGAIAIAMSYALSYLKVVDMPQGGSITIASFFPLMLYSYIFGVKKGIFTCMVYGVLQALQDPWIVHPAQFLLDYPIAFSCIGLTGLFSNMKSLDKFPQIQFAIGGIITACGRFCSSFLSGVFAFGGSATFSLGYNSYVFADAAIAIIVGVIVLSSKAFVAEMKKINHNSNSIEEKQPIKNTEE